MSPEYVLWILTADLIWKPVMIAHQRWHCENEMLRWSDFLCDIAPRRYWVQK